MRIVRVILVSAAALCLLPSQVQAFTSRAKATAITVGGTGVTPTQSLSVAVVNQGSTPPGTSGSLGFGTGIGNAFLDSDEALSVTITTNLAANRLIIYTDNLNGSASPQYCEDTAKGNDGGGLVGDPTPVNPSSLAHPDNCKVTVPLLWAIESANADHGFGTGVGDDEVFITDLAHVVTFVDAALGAAAATSEKDKLDTLNIRVCQASGGDAANLAATGTDPKLYPQFFGTTGIDKDLCYEGPLPVPSITSAGGTNIMAAVTATCSGVAATSACPAGSKLPFAEELSKNISVVAFNCTGTTCTAPNLTTPSVTDTITVTSPFFLPIAGDFRGALGGLEYATSTLTLELVTQ